MRLCFVCVCVWANNIINARARTRREIKKSVANREKYVEWKKVCTVGDVGKEIVRGRKKYMYNIYGRYTR